MISVAYGNNVFLTMGSRYSFTSVDGINWNSYDLSGQNVAKRDTIIRFANGQFVATSGTYISYSTNGYTWTSVTPPFTNAYYLEYGNNTCMMMNNVLNSTKIAISY